MAPKASLSKRPTSTREEYEIQLGSEIEDNDDIIGIYYDGLVQMLLNRSL